MKKIIPPTAFATSFMEHYAAAVTQISQAWKQQPDNFQGTKEGRDADMQLAGWGAHWDLARMGMTDPAKCRGIVSDAEKILGGYEDKDDVCFTAFRGVVVECFDRFSAAAFDANFRRRSLLATAGAGYFSRGFRRCNDAALREQFVAYLKGLLVEDKNPAFTARGDFILDLMDKNFSGKGGRYSGYKGMGPLMLGHLTDGLEQKNDPRLRDFMMPCVESLPVRTVSALIQDKSFKQDLKAG